MASKRLDEIYLLGKPSPTITGNKSHLRDRFFKCFFTFTMKKRRPFGKQLQEQFLKDDLDNIFDMAHQDALDMITIVEDKEFLIAQREKGRRGSMAGVDLVLTEKEVRAQKRKVAEEKRKLRSKEEEEEPKTAILESSSTDSTSSAESSGLELSEAENDFKCVRFLAILEFVKLKPEWGQLIS